VTETLEQIADYELVRPIGRGNYGEFYLARPPARLGLDIEFVAVKVVSGMPSEDAFRRATRELRAFALVRSPYLITLFDAGQDGNSFFYSMEYFPLGSLGNPTEAVSTADRMRAVADAARAADELHEAGVVHRSIKPANVMLHATGAKLSDLGLAEAMSPGQTATSIGGIGAIEYLDPAILLGERAARSTDIWSLGATLHKALTGQNLWGDVPTDDPLVAIRKVLAASPVISPDLTGPERAVVERCLAPLTERYGTAGEVADAIDRINPSAGSPA
jgi:serine/threonine protein kinase